MLPVKSLVPRKATPEASLTVKVCTCLLPKSKPMVDSSLSLAALPIATSHAEN